MKVTTMRESKILEKIMEDMFEIEKKTNSRPHTILLSKRVGEEITGLPADLWYALKDPDRHLEICGCQVKLLDKDLKYDYIFVGQSDSTVKIQKEGPSLSFCCLNACKYFEEIGVNKTSIYGKCKFRDLNKYVDQEHFCEIDKIVSWNEKTLANNKELRDSKEKR